MADWDSIHYGFNASDETVNFGTRVLAGIDNLYETSTLATLSNSDSISDQVPCINAIIKHGLVIFSINKSIRIFDSLSCDNIILNTALDDEIDVICSNGLYLLLCLRNGTVYIFEHQCELNVICHRSIIENTDVSEPFFVGAFVEEAPSLSFILVTKCGVVYRFSVSIDPLQSPDQDPYIIFDLNCCIRRAAYIHPTLFLCGECTYTCTVETNRVTFEENTILKRAFPLGCGKLLGLQYDGSLIVMYTKPYLSFPLDTKTLFNEIILISDSNGFRILGITMADQDDNVYLQLINFTDFTIIFSIKLLQEICLVVPEHIHDEILYISMLKGECGIGELRLQSITETNPESRLKRLIKRQKFNEAEKFANLFNLNLSDLQKAKAQSIADKLVCTKNDIDDLINFMNVIDDNEFKIGTCVEVHLCCSSLEDVERILKYGCLCAQTDTQLDNNDQYLCDNISQLLFRFCTFLELIRCGREDNNVHGWNSFSSCDLLMEVCCAINHNRIDEAIIIYNRLDAVTIYELNEDVVAKILQPLNNLPIGRELPFLYTFMPLTLSYIPLSLNLFVTWMLERVKHIEMREPHNFPDKAIEFLESMTQMLTVNYLKGINLEMSHIIDQNALNQLSDHLHALQILKTLKHKYRISLPFQEMLQGPKALAQILLSGPGVHILQDESFFKDFIHTFSSNDEYKPDEIISELAKDIIQYEEELWIKVIPLIISSICSINLKLESVLHILKAANVPWSPAIREIAKSSLQYSHPLVKVISKEIEYEPKCVILYKNQYKLDLQQFINSIAYVKMAIHIIINVNLPLMVEDIFQICTSVEERHEANMALMVHFIEKGEVTKALQILDNNKREESMEYCKKLITLATFVIESEKFISLQKYYYNIVRSINCRLIQNAHSNFERSFLQDTANDLQCVYQIRNTFNLQIETYQLQCDTEKNNILYDIINKLCFEFPDTANCFKIQKEIASYLRISEDTVLLKYCQQIGDFNIILKACEKMYENGDSNAESLCGAVSLILKCMGVSAFGFEESNKKFFFAEDVNLLVNGLRLAKQMIIRAILVSSEGEVNSYVELANWIQTTYFWIQDCGKEFSVELRKEYGMKCFTVQTVTAFNAFRDTLNLYLKFMDNYVTNSTRYLLYLNQNMMDTTEDQLLNELRLLYPLVKCLAHEGQALTSLKIILMLQRGLMYRSNTNPEWFETLNEIKNHCVQQVQHKNFSSTYIDKDFAFNLLLCNVEQAKPLLSTSINTYKRDLEKFYAIAQIHLRFLKRTDCNSGQEFYYIVIRMVNWWKRIKNGCISYDQFFSKPPKELVKRLIKFNQLTLESLQEFCREFGINTKECYKIYFKQLLMSWQACVEILECGTQTIVAKYNEDDLYNNCLDVIRLIDDKEAILELTNCIWKTVSFYHYEVFLCILKIQSSLKDSVDHSHQKMLLSFLKSYIRVSKPGQREMEEWYTANPKSHSIDNLSELRLPFTTTLFTNGVWNIIRPEVNLNTYKKWFDATLFLKENFTKDTICSYVIKEVVTSRVLQSISSDTWIMDSKHGELIQEISECVQHMSNLEQASAAVYLLATNIPGGADQVKVISLCYDYALKYQEQYPHTRDVQKAVIKVQNKYYSISVTHILHKNKLAEKQYLDMVSYPATELIDALYMDERICKKALLATLNCPDINMAVDEIADLHNLDIVKKRHAMLKNWLLNDLTNMGNGDSNIDEQNLIRASYVCTSGDITEWRAWLMKQSKGKTSSTNLNFKARVLKCFYNISDANIVEKLTNTSHESFRNYIEKLTITSNLEYLGCGLTIDRLNESNKYDLLNHLACLGTIGIKTMSSICIMYNILEVKYWTEIITRMLKMNMIDELKRCIYFLKNRLEYYNKAFYIEAWQKVIDKSFELPYNFNEQEIMKLYVSNFAVIQSCPVLVSLNLENIARNCIQMKKYEFVVLILRHLPSGVQKAYALELFEHDSSICKKTEKLSCYGFWGISQECLFLSEIINKSDHATPTKLM